jgi:hypothetical protein
MKIRLKMHDLELTVYGIYWREGVPTTFCCFPKGTHGLSGFRQEQFDIIDPTIDGDFVFRVTDSNMNGIFHKHVLTDNLLDDLFDHDEEAYQKFRHCLGRRRSRWEAFGHRRFSTGKPGHPSTSTTQQLPVLQAGAN